MQPKTRDQRAQELAEAHGKMWRNWPFGHIQTDASRRFHEWRLEWWDQLWEWFPEELNKQGWARPRSWLPSR